MKRSFALFLFSLLLGGLVSLPAQAQVERPSDAFYIKAGAGISDYVGDATGTSGLADVFDTDKYNEDAFPFAALGEIGYQTSPSFGIGLGYQYGQHPLIDNRENEFPGSIGTTRHVVQVLGRYTFKAQDWTVAPYVDGGANVSFGGQSTGIGYSVGLGFDAAVSSRTSLFLEGRFNTVFDDQATDGIDGSAAGDALNPFPVAGVKVSLHSNPTPPRVLSLDGPTSVQTGEEVSYAASVNAEEADRPLTYQWDFGDGSTGSGMTASHTFRTPGTYTVRFTARNEAGEASQTLTVTAEEPPTPAQVVSINANPNPVDEGEPVSFSANVEGDSPISYDWDFGDGATGSGERPTHTYDEPGTYTVELTASNEVGESSQTLTMTVERALPSICMSVNEFNSAFFERNSSTLTEDGEEALQENLDILTQCPNLTVQVEGFSAPGERNAEALSEDRAEAVAGFYEDGGVSANRIMTEGQGAPEGVTTKKGGTQQYRRVDSIPQRQ
jgi:outer membrane protein OmpA-like peptidoglycan-associated protein